jgi:anthranilate phosphoribosyltransferase
VRDIVRLNAAAAALAFAGPRPDAAVATQLAPFFARAGEVIDSGAAAALLDSWVAATQAARG